MGSLRAPLPRRCARWQIGTTPSSQKTTSRVAELANCGGGCLALARFLRYEDSVCLSSTAVASVAVSHVPTAGDWNCYLRHRCRHGSRAQCQDVWARILSARDSPRACQGACRSIDIWRPRGERGPCWSCWRFRCSAVPPGNPSRMRVPRMIEARQMPPLSTRPLRRPPMGRPARHQACPRPRSSKPPVRSSAR